MQAQYLTNQLYDAQAWWIRDVILGEFELPTKKEMLSDIALWQADKEMQKTNSTKILFQSRYLNDLWKKTNCPRFNVDAIVQMFEDWELLRKSNIMKSRSKPFKSVIDGTLGMVSNISWSDIKLDVT
jgi:trimethylamine monooxygenase